MRTGRAEKPISSASDPSTWSGLLWTVIGWGRPKAGGLPGGNIITKWPMHAPVSPGTALLAMSAPARVAWALAVSVALWLGVWWAL